MHQIRAVMLSQYVEVAASVGLDGAAMLRQAGLHHEMLRDPENRVPAKSAVRLLEDSAAKSGREDFGLLIAQRRTFASLGPVSMLLERLPNLREVVQVCTAYQRQFNDILHISLEDGGDVCLIKFQLLPTPPGDQMTDLAVGIGAGVLSGASQGTWRPEAAHLSRKAPKRPAPWRRFFGVPVEFSAPFNGFSTTRESMLRRNPGADEAMARNARRLLGFLPVEAGPRLLHDRVRRTIGTRLPNGRAGVDQVARDLGLSPRSLQRQLEKEGATFAGLLQELREELADAYVARSDRPITAIAGLLGYASPSAFTRWFNASFGMAPQEWRARALSRESGSVQ